MVGSSLCDLGREGLRGPTEHVVGSKIEVEYQVADNASILEWLPELYFIDDKVGKSVRIYHHADTRPIAAFGNLDGNFEMLEWLTSGHGLRHPKGQAMAGLRIVPLKA